MRRLFAANPELVSDERLILHSLRDGDWHTAGEIGERTGLAPFNVRATLKALTRSKLVRRSFHSTLPDERSSWQLTGAGHLEEMRTTPL